MFRKATQNEFWTAETISKVPANETIEKKNFLKKNTTKNVDMWTELFQRKPKELGTIVCFIPLGQI